MKMWEMLQAAYDFWRPNKYGIKPYLCKDGRKHPVAIICPGGAYSMVCSFVEGMPIAKALNKCGYHAVVAYYRTKKKARFPNPHEDLKRAITDTFSHAEDWNLETDGWSLWGSSAGGHLAASFCSTGSTESLTKTTSFPQYNISRRELLYSLRLMPFYYIIKSL